MTLFQATVLIWWLALGAIGQACWAAAHYRAFRREMWNERDFLPSLILTTIFGPIGLGAAVCFEPRKEPRR